MGTEMAEHNKTIPLPGQSVVFEGLLLVGVRQTTALKMPNLISRETETIVELTNDVTIKGKTSSQN